MQVLYEGALPVGMGRGSLRPTVLVKLTVKDVWLHVRGEVVENVSRRIDATVR